MNEKRLTWKRIDRKKLLLFSIILIFLIVGVTLTLSRPSSTTVYVATNGSGDFNCDGSDDQIEINEALAYVAENPKFTTVHLEGPNTYVISDSILEQYILGDPTA